LGGKDQCAIPNAAWIQEGKGTRDCLATMTQDINNSQTVVAFLDISGAYDNVIIDILCEVMVEQELPIKRVKKNYVTKYSKSHEKNKSLIIFLIIFVSPTNLRTAIVFYATEYKYGRKQIE
jgi:hypothetical protein